MLSQIFFAILACCCTTHCHMGSLSQHSPFLLPQLPLTVLLFLLLLLLPLCFFFFFFCFLVFRFSAVCHRLSHDQQAWSESLCCSSPSPCPSSSLPASSSLLQLLCIPAMLAVLFLLCASSIMVSCRSSGVQQYLCRPACLPCLLACLLALLLACLPRLSRLPRSLACLLACLLARLLACWLACLLFSYLPPQLSAGLQDYLCRRADKHMIPKVDNTNVDRSVATIHATVLACLRHTSQVKSITSFNPRERV